MLKLSRLVVGEWYGLAVGESNIKQIQYSFIV
jgi:hypothetical protein